MRFAPTLLGFGEDYDEIVGRSPHGLSRAPNHILAAAFSAANNPRYMDLLRRRAMVLGWHDADADLGLRTALRNMAAARALDGRRGR